MERRSASPVRTCVGCRRRGPKEDLVRIVRLSAGGVAVDRRGRAPGRGAYICSNVGCFERGLGKGRLERALRTTMDEPARKRLTKEFTEGT